MISRPFYASHDLPVCGFPVPGPRGKVTKCPRAPEANMLRRCAEHADATASGMLPVAAADDDVERVAIREGGGDEP